MSSLYENFFLVLLFLTIVTGIAAVLAFLGDWLEKKFPWRDPW